MKPPSLGLMTPSVRAPAIRALGIRCGRARHTAESSPAAPDPLQPVLFEVAHRLGLPGSAGTAGSNSRFDDTEVPVAVVGIHAPGVEPGSGGRQQDLTG